MTWKIKFDRETCIGCAACNSACPDNWDFDEDELKAKPKKLKLDELGCNKEAEEVCPVDCIEIVEE